MIHGWMRREAFFDEALGGQGHELGKKRHVAHLVRKKPTTSKAHRSRSVVQFIPPSSGPVRPATAPEPTAVTWAGVIHQTTRGGGSMVSLYTRRGFGWAPSF